MTDNKLKIEFAPGCFDDFEGTQEELDALIKEIQDSFESGEYLVKAVPLTEESFDELPEHVQIQIAEAMGIFEDDEIVSIDEIDNKPSRPLH